MSDILNMVVGTISEATKSANEAAEKIAAATTDRTKRVHEIRTDSETTDEQIKAFQDWFEKANAKIEEEVSKVDEYIKGKYLSDMSEEDLNALKEQYKHLKEQVQAAVKFAKTVPGFSDEALKDVPELKTLRGGSSGGTGEGGKRPRVERMSFATNAEGPWTEIVTKGKNAKGEEVEKTNFTLAATRLSKESGTKVETKDLQSAAFEAAGTDDLKTLDGKVFTFAHSVGEKTYWLKVQPAVSGSAETEAETEAPATEAEATESE